MTQAELPWSDLFWSRVDKSGACWLWTAAKGRKGYGQMRISGKLRIAHRLSWELANGPIPGGLFVCHRCDVTSCVNPAHLFLGTNRDNILDSMAKGRLNAKAHGVPGERHSQARFTDLQVQEMRAARASGRTCEDIARQFGTTNGTISRICTGKRRSQNAVY